MNVMFNFDPTILWNIAVKTLLLFYTAYIQYRYKNMYKIEYQNYRLKTGPANL
jgi:hypothetical protein